MQRPHDGCFDIVDVLKIFFGTFLLRNQPRTLRRMPLAWAATANKQPRTDLISHVPFAPVWVAIANK